MVVSSIVYASVPRSVHAGASAGVGHIRKKRSTRDFFFLPFSFGEMCSLVLSSREGFGRLLSSSTFFVDKYFFFGGARITQNDLWTRELLALDVFCVCVYFCETLVFNQCRHPLPDKKTVCTKVNPCVFFSCFEERYVSCRACVSNVLGQVYIRHLAAHLSTKYGWRVVTKNWRGIGLGLSTRRYDRLASGFRLQASEGVKRAAAPPGKSWTGNIFFTFVPVFAADTNQCVI